MQLLYVYFKELNGILEQGLNFGGEFLFQYDPNTKKLEIKANPFFIKGFFNDINRDYDVAEILNVTALIAGNGAGKTSVLNFLRNNLSAGCGGIGQSVLFVYEDQGNKIIYHFDDIEIVNSDFSNYGFQLKKLSPDRKVIKSDKAGVPDFEYTTPPKIRDFERTDFVFFSNIFDGYFSTEVKGTYDISTNYLIRHDLIEDIEHKRISSDTRHSEIQTFIRHEIDRQIRFINVFKDKNLVPFDLPEMLLVHATREYGEFQHCFDSNDMQVLEEYKLSFLVNQIFSAAKYQSSSSKEWKRKAEIYFITACIVNFLYELATDYRSIQTTLRFEFSNQDFDSKIDLREAVIGLLENINKQAMDFEITMDKKFFIWTGGVRNFIEKISDFIEPDLVATGDGTSFGINIQKRPADFFSFNNIYMNSFQLKPYLNFGWRQMSTGEIAFLNIFSRFYNVAERQQKSSGNPLSKSIIVLIDEGEAYLHPTWQKKFLKLILDFLPIVFKDKDEVKRSIQVIFATNSAIPASDLPNSNIIFLEKENGKVIVRNSLEDRKRTFGANINTLLADSFFLRDGTIGDFAKSKINHIIELLQDNHDVILKNKDYLEKSINLIGEPLIKNKLVQMLTDRLTLNLIGMNDRIDLLERELNELKKNR